MLTNFSLNGHYSSLFYSRQQGALLGVSKERDWSAVLGANVRSRRKALRVTQEELGCRVGVDVRYLSGIERGQENPSLRVIMALSQTLGCLPADLLALTWSQ
ncbi:helix-turn-helix domain-containing protein [Sandarakinorhabdus limnophila]|uniref:helix-turn-helix domain-containing protein n=1 Tax=Sandarakinorhabdus limnophila TaxID=210512 RepID=UPI000A0193FA|nr:helix-turn-helix transcriptional regulator [Sandarakinorhabdus limnophila]